MLRFAIAYDKISQYLSNYIIYEDDYFTLHFAMLCPMSLSIPSGVGVSTLYTVNSDTLKADPVHSLAESSLPECIQLDTYQ